MRVAKSPEGNILIIEDNGKIASRMNGKWVTGNAFSASEMSGLVPVEDEQQCQDLRIEARVFFAADFFRKMCSGDDDPPTDMFQRSKPLDED